MSISIKLNMTWFDKETKINRLDYFSVRWEDHFILINSYPFIKKISGEIYIDVSAKGYGRIRFKGKRWLVHRVIAVIAGILKDNELVIDHIDGNPTNNSPLNLRECSVKTNLRNCKISLKNKSGVCGVYSQTTKRKYMYYVVQWSDDNGRHRKLFRYNEENKEEKFKEATELRDKIISTHGYTTRHGKE